jgi:hypothetical protein
MLRRHYLYKLQDIENFADHITSRDEVAVTGGVADILPTATRRGLTRVRTFTLSLL